MLSESPQAADPLPQAAWAQFFYGAAYPLRAILFIRRERLWRLVAIPVVVHLLLFVAVLGLIDWYVLPAVGDSFVALRHRFAPNPEYAETVRVLWSVGHLLLWVVMLPLSLVVAGAVVLALGQFVCGPWLDLLAERVESLVLHRAALPWTWRRAFEGLLGSLGDLLVGPLYLLVIYLPVAVLSLLPVVGGISSVVAGALFIAHQCLGHTLGRAWLSYRARWQAVLRNRWLCGGFGAATLLLLWLPFFGLLTLPVATVGGTLLCCDLLRTGRVRPAA